MHSNKVSSIDTPYARQTLADHHYARQVHIKRTKRILLIFAAVFLILGFQIVQSKRSLTKINGDIATSQKQLTHQKNVGKNLKQQKKQLHDPDYLQQVIRSKYNYTKKGETVYNLNN